MQDIKSGLLEEKKECRLLFGALSLLLTAIVIAACVGLFLRSQIILKEEMLATARSHFNNIVLMRRWNAGYGGVYVRKRPGVESNPYLKNPDIHTVDGVTLTLKNPALMTREVSELTSKESICSFHITSLKPINPANAPDEFERKALQDFERGADEVYSRSKEGGEIYFNYIAPLFVEQSCLECHGDQGYKVGDIRGGIRVKFNIRNLLDLHDTTVREFLLLAACFTVVAIFTLYLFMHRFEGRLNRAREKIRDMALKDPLTGIFNRRYLMSRLGEELERAGRNGKNVCCVMLDIDYFKKINDQYGHLFGDAVLKELSARIQKIVRQYDTFARYGGEEFVLILADTERAECIRIAQRVMKTIKEKPFVYKTTSCMVTVSLGLACSLAVETDSETLLKHADDALYQAKRGGRDRIIIYPSENAE